MNIIAFLSWFVAFGYEEGQLENKFLGELAVALATAFSFTTPLLDHFSILSFFTAIFSIAVNATSFAIILWGLAQWVSMKFRNSGIWKRSAVLRSCLFAVTSIAFLFGVKAWGSPLNIRDIQSFNRDPKDDSTLYYRRIFNAFPNSIGEIRKRYKYKVGDSGSPPDYSSEIIQFEHSFYHVDEVEFFEKVFSIGKTGRWMPDEIQAFQSMTHRIVFQNMDGFALFLESKDEKEIKGFFYFFFDDLGPRWDNFPCEFNLWEKTFNRLFTIAREEYHSRWGD